MRKLLTTLCLCLGIWGAYRIEVHRQTEGFRLPLIQGSLPNVPSLPAPALLKEVFAQPFHYLDKGSQCYVFESADGKYVLKFFRFNRFNPKKMCIPEICPSFLRKIIEHNNQERRQKKVRLATSCALTVNKFAQETALIYLHPAPSKQPLGQIHICDKLGRDYFLPAASLPFALQRKGTPLYPYLHTLILKKDVPKTEQALTSLMELLKTRLKKNILDADAEIHKNAGFVGDTPCFLDFGSFYESILTPTSQTRELEKTTRKLLLWLQAHGSTLESSSVTSSTTVCSSEKG